MNNKNKLVNAHVLLQCADAKHESMCEELRDSLLNNFNEVRKAGTVTQIMGDGNFCVVGVAKINLKKREKFENALRNLKANSKKNSKVKDVKIDFEEID